MSIGRVWSRFGRIRKLRIQDMPRDRGEELTELFLRYYVKDEPFHRATNTASCPETIKFYEDYGKSLSDPNFSRVICCPDDGDEVTDIMDISAMKLTRKSNFSLMDKKEYKVFSDRFNKYLNGLLLLYRRLICEAYGVPVAGAWVVTASSQSIAARHGWETVYEVPFEELGKRYGLVFTDVPTTAKYMIVKTRSNEDKQNSGINKQ